MQEKKRVVVIALVLFSFFSLLIVQYFRIQIIEGEKWTHEALLQHEFIVKEPFRRGSFFSNTSLKEGHPETPKPLVFDVTKFHLFIDPVSIPEKLRLDVAKSLLPLLDNHEKEHYLAEFQKKSRSRKIASWLERKDKEAIEKWWGGYAKKNKIPRNALYFVTDYQRSYPFGKLLGQALHTIREFKDEATQEAMPTGGLEAYFNDTLNGKLGKKKLLRSPLNPLEIDKVIVEPEDGADIYLTINHFIQAIAEEELERGVKAVQAKGGWAVMMDPYTGEVFALAQYPFFEPGNYKEYFNCKEKIEETKVKSITDAFEPGSIMKPITIAIALLANEELKGRKEAPLFDPLAKMATTRAFFPGRSRPLKDVPVTHKALNMCMAVQKSSNVYVAELVDRIVNRLGNEWYRKQLTERFGFGKKCKIELPGETMGLVPKPGKKHPNGALEWSLPTPCSLAMGHNILATSLQMVRAFAVFANGGYLVQPTLVKKIVKMGALGEEKTLYDMTHRDKKSCAIRVLPKELTQEVVRAMKYATKVGGTGRLADVPGYSEAGKTGTAEKIIRGVYAKDHHISSFIGFVPASLDEKVKCRFVLLISIDDPAPIILEGGVKAHFGGGCAAPVFREIAQRTLEYLGTPPDDPFGYPAGDPKHDAEKADWFKEVKELKVLYEEWRK